MKAELLPNVTLSEAKNLMSLERHALCSPVLV